MAADEGRTGTRCMNVVGLFAGVGGLELGLQRAGHRTLLLCESDPCARAVLERRFHGVRVEKDVRKLRELPADTDLVAAGFPCQDLSQAGLARGIRGARSGLVDEVFRLLENHDVPWLLLENVPFMLRLGRGGAMSYIVDRLEELGFRWAYRVIDARAFGLPQRRERVFLLASRMEDPSHRLFATDAGVPRDLRHRGKPCGFYWTEGNRGLGWAVDAIPTLKGGSSFGIPSPPAVWMPDGRFLTPGIEDAEQLQGFPRGWTGPAANVDRASLRWRLIGNAVAVPVARWIGRQLASRRRQPRLLPARAMNGTWPLAAASGDGERCEVDASAWPVRYKPRSLEGVLRSANELTFRAARGFRDRLMASRLHAPPEFCAALNEYVRERENLGKSRKPRRTSREMETSA